MGMLLGAFAKKEQERKEMGKRGEREGENEWKEGSGENHP